MTYFDEHIAMIYVASDRLSTALSYRKDKGVNLFTFGSGKNVQMSIVSKQCSIEEFFKHLNKFCIDYGSEDLNINISVEFDDDAADLFREKLDSDDIDYLEQYIQKEFLKNGYRIDSLYNELPPSLNKLNIGETLLENV